MLRIDLARKELSCCCNFTIFHKYITIEISDQNRILRPYQCPKRHYLFMTGGSNTPGVDTLHILKSTMNLPNLVVSGKIEGRIINYTATTTN